MGAIESPARWQAGEVIDDLYEVVRLAGKGSMGEVYQVRHLQWGVDLAAKVPYPDGSGPGDLEDFVGEAEAWVSLGLHPNICCCHYVRQIGGVHMVFAELVAGGSLENWIAGDRLYQGPVDQRMLRVLDVAIQFAWGLGHAHSRGMVHQDVKPANVLIDPSDGVTVKVTDFGMARPNAGARVIVAGSGTDVPGNVSILVSQLGWTPEYASPEQARAEALTQSTDIYSYAVSVLEMFTGKRLWKEGRYASESLTAGPAKPGPPQLPAALASLLGRCLDPCPEQRPGSMTEIATEIAEIYHRASGSAYPRTPPRAAELLADELANRAVSLLDLGRTAEAEEMFAAALNADPQHLTATYNAGLLRWRNGAITDETLLREIEALRADLGDPWQIGYLCALIHLERRDLSAAEDLLTDLTQIRPHDQAIQQTTSTLRSLKTTDARHSAVRRIPWQTYPKGFPPEHAIRLTPDLRFALTGSGDHTVRLWNIRSGKQLKALAGHTDQIDSVDISADGRRAISGSRDQTVRFWDLDTGTLLHTVSTKRWLDVKSPSEPWLADLQNKLNEIEGYSRYRVSLQDGTLTLGQNDAAPVRMSTSGSIVLWAEADGGIQVWDFSARRHLLTLDGRSYNINNVEVSPAGNVALSAGQALTLWDLAAGNWVWHEASSSSVDRVWLSHVDRIWFGPHGDVAAVLGNDKVIRVWDLANHRCIHTLNLPSDCHPRSAALSTESRFLLIGDGRGPVTFWDLETGCCLRTFTGHQGSVSAVLLSPDNRDPLAFSAGDDGTARLWRLPGGFTAPAQLSLPRRHGELTRTSDRMQVLITAAEQARDDGRTEEALSLLSQARGLPGCERAPQLMTTWRSLGEHAVRIGLRTAWPAKTLQGRAGAYTDAMSGRVDLTRDAQLGAFSGDDDRIQIWDLAEGRRERFIDAGQGAVHLIRLTSDGQKIVSAGQDSTIKTWSVNSGECLNTFRFRELRRVAVSDNAQLGLVVDQYAATEMSLWDLAEGCQLQAVSIPESFVLRLWLSPDGRRAVSGSEDNLIRLWDLTVGRCVMTLHSGSERVSSVCLTSDERFILAAGSRNFSARQPSPDPERLLDRIRMWDTATGECVRMFDAQPSNASRLQLSGDDRFLFSGSIESAVRVWDVATGHCLRTLDGHLNMVTDLAITPDANFVLTSDDDETLRLWELDWELQARENLV